MDEAIPSQPATPAGELTQRIAADFAAGRTVALQPAELANAALRHRLPDLLDELSHASGQPPAGLRIPGYTVLAEIGHGGMSTVYLARHHALGRHVALKIVPGWIGGRERARDRLLREARAMARLGHPNIVVVHDVVDHGEMIAIAMEWVDGLTLAGLLRALPPRATAGDLAALRHALGTPADGTQRIESTVERTFVRMISEVALAVHHVHQKGLLHLDVKPSNVLVRRDGTPLLADFGVVREIDLVLTHTQSFAGTPSYAAPEQLRRDDRAFGPRTDVYGLGITLYELLARRQPLRQNGLTRLLQDVQAGRIPPLQQQAAVATDLANVVHKAIAPDPHHRYATPAEFAAELQAFLDGRAVAARPPTRAERLRRWMRAEPWKALVAGVLLVMVPVSIGLATKLLLEMPYAAEGRLQAMRLRHAEAVQVSFQDLLVHDQLGRGKLRALQAARREDRSNPNVLAGLLTALADDPEAALAEVAAAERDGIDSPVLAATRRRIEQGRLFFTEADVTNLQGADDALTRILLILDRIRWYDNTLCQEDLEPVVDLLDRAVLVSDRDPLLYGLGLFVAAVTGDQKSFANHSYALRNRDAAWLDRGSVQAWRFLALRLTDRDAALAATGEYLERHPTDATARHHHVLSLNAARRFEEALTFLDQCPGDPGEERGALSWCRAVALARLGRADEALALVPPAGPDCPWGTVSRLRVLEIAAPEVAERTYRALLTGPRQPLLVVHRALDAASVRGDVDFIEAVCRAGREWYPEIHVFRWQLAKVVHEKSRIGNSNDHAEAAQLTQGLRMPRQHVDSLAPLLARIRCWQRDWNGLLEVCDRWEQWGRHAYAWQFYRGIALARLGRPLEARPCFEQHVRLIDGTQLAAEAAGSPLRGPGSRPFVEAHAELLWICLDPSLPAEQRYPNTGQRIVAESRGEIEQRAMARPWLTYVLAELHAADGDRELALSTAETAQRLCEGNARPALTDPSDVRERIEELLRRLR